MLLGTLQDSNWMMATVLYGAGLRLRECLRIRVKDIASTPIRSWCGKGGVIRTGSRGFRPLSMPRFCRILNACAHNTNKTWNAVLGGYIYLMPGDESTPP